jgi:hypothetical protein
MMEKITEYLVLFLAFSSLFFPFVFIHKLVKKKIPFWRALFQTIWAVYGIFYLIGVIAIIASMFDY